jgi:hypothetical protein
MMTTVWLCRRDCEEGKLPRLCLRCGHPTARLVKAEFFGTLLWRQPVTVLLAAIWGWESAVARVPLCDRHRHHWRDRRLILLGSFVGAPAAYAAAVVCAAYWMGEPAIALAVLLSLPLQVVLITAGGYAFTGIRATEVHENGVRLTGVNHAFACACQVNSQPGPIDLRAALAKYPPGRTHLTGGTVTDEL